MRITSYSIDACRFPAPRPPPTGSSNISILSLLVVC